MDSRRNMMKKLKMPRKYKKKKKSTAKISSRNCKKESRPSRVNMKNPASIKYKNTKKNLV